MKKYNLRKIMKAAWERFKWAKKNHKVMVWTFGDCLKWAWKKEKITVKAKETMKNEKFILDIKGAKIIVNSKKMALTGETYSVRITIKESGFIWNRDEKAWVTENKKSFCNFVEAWI